jgi:hypothetical protein
MTRRSRNSLWRRLVVAWSVLFVVSTWLYCMATLAALRQVERWDAAETESGLLRLFRDHGEYVLAAELAGLALCAAGLWLGERE